jgi:hypothetical protein
LPRENWPEGLCVGAVELVDDEVIGLEDVMLK